MRFHHVLFLASPLSVTALTKMAAFNPNLGLVIRTTCAAEGLDQCPNGECYNESAGDVCCDTGMCQAGFYCGTGVNADYCCSNGSSEAECAAIDANGTSGPTQEGDGGINESSSPSTSSFSSATSSSAHATVTMHNSAVSMNEASLLATIAAIAGFALI